MESVEPFLLIFLKIFSRKLYNALILFELNHYAQIERLLIFNIEQPLNRVYSAHITRVTLTETRHLSARAAKTMRWTRDNLIIRKCYGDEFY
ncbi:hypothetical protein [Edwardsiella tarda]|uniref:hypothetical protein n=1 Tax=Edwardsiella tarda TaxID=636 RepID=UPI00083B6130|nr:hypothetical protein [Edwardsiella tarda]